MSGRKAWRHATESATARGYGAAWQALREQVLMRDCGLCVPCGEAGRVTPATAVDHVRPKAQGGDDAPGNLQSICGPCHERKTAEEMGRRVRPTIGADGWPVA